MQLPHAACGNENLLEAHAVQLLDAAFHRRDTLQFARQPDIDKKCPIRGNRLVINGRSNAHQHGKICRLLLQIQTACGLDDNIFIIELNAAPLLQNGNQRIR